MRTITAIYKRDVELTNGNVAHDTIELEAECEQFGDAVCIVWTDACLATIAAAGLDGEELVGCDECMTEAFFESEREACRVASVRQRVGAERAA